VCVVCSFQLRDFYNYKKKAVLTQRGLYQFVTGSIKAETASEEDENSVFVKEEYDADREYIVVEEVNDDIPPPSACEFLDFRDFGKFFYCPIVRLTHQMLL